MPRILLIFIILVIAFFESFADVTRLDINRLIFSNGGGFKDRLEYMEVLSIMDDGSYRSKGIDLGASEYIERVPDRVDRFPHIIPDLIGVLNAGEGGYIPMGDTTGNFQSSPMNGSDGTLGGTNTLLVGDLLRHFLSFKGNEIDAWSTLPVITNTNLAKEVRDSKLLLQTDEYRPGDMTFGRGKGPDGSFNNGDDIPVLTYRGSVLLPDGTVEKRLGINQVNPPEVFFVNGDLKVEGGQINGAAGVFENTPAIFQDSWTTGWLTIAEENVTIKYVDHKVIVMGNSTFQTSSAGGTAIRIIVSYSPSGLEYESDSTGETELDKIKSNSGANPTEVQFDGSYSQEYYSLGTSWSGVIPAYPASHTPDNTNERTFTFKLQMKDWENKLSRNPSAYATDLVILGLPGASIGQDLVANEITVNVLEVPDPASIHTDPGNYLQKNKVVFKNGGYIMDGKKSMVIRDQAGFKKFKASQLNAAKAYRMAILELLKDLSGNSGASKYSLFLGGEWGGAPNGGVLPVDDYDTKTMGFSVSGLINPMTTPVRSILPVTYNIQSWEHANAGASGGYLGNPTPLTIKAATYVGSNGFTISNAEGVPGRINPRISINMPPPAYSESNSNTTLFIDGNVAFTGNYQGQYGAMYQETCVNTTICSQEMQSFTPGIWNFLVIGNANMFHAANAEKGIKTQLTLPNLSTKSSKKVIFSFDPWANAQYGFVSILSAEVSITSETDKVVASVIGDVACREMSVVILATPKEITVDN